jgi:hypothetical protein
MVVDNYVIPQKTTRAGQPPEIKAVVQRVLPPIQYSNRDFLEQRKKLIRQRVAQMREEREWQRELRQQRRRSRYRATTAPLARIEDYLPVRETGETSLQETGNNQGGAPHVMVRRTENHHSISIYFAPTIININTTNYYPR